MNGKKMSEHEVYDRLYAAIGSLEDSISELRSQALAIATADMTDAEVYRLETAMELERQKHFYLDLPDSLRAARSMAGRDE